MGVLNICQGVISISQPFTEKENISEIYINA